MRALDAEEASPTRPRRPRAWHVRPFWIGALSGASGLAVALAGAFLLFTAVSSNTVLEAVADAHLRSLSSRHLIDVVSSDRHTVKPWFAGRTDVSPPVADFAAQGYKLLGGRAENLGHERAAVLVYEHGAHLINVFSWSARGPAARAGRAQRLPHGAVEEWRHRILRRIGCRLGRAQRARRSYKGRERGRRPALTSGARE